MNDCNSHVHRVCEVEERPLRLVVLRRATLSGGAAVARRSKQYARIVAWHSFESVAALWRLQYRTD